jgi:hypothetical protein
LYSTQPSTSKDDFSCKPISNALFAAGVAVVVLGLLGGTTWLSGGFWAPDGGYSRFVWPIIGVGSWTISCRARQHSWGSAKSALYLTLNLCTFLASALRHE